VRISLTRRPIIELVQDKTGGGRVGPVSCIAPSCLPWPPAGKQGHTYANSGLPAVRASPRHLRALPPLETIGQSAGLGVAVTALATSTVGSGAGAAPAARRPARDPRRKLGTEAASRSALRTPTNLRHRGFPKRGFQPLGLRHSRWAMASRSKVLPTPLPCAPLFRPVPDLATVPMASIAPRRGGMRPRGRGKAVPCLCAAL
jgi:hypothetical protein